MFGSADSIIRGTGGGGGGGTIDLLDIRPWLRNLTSTLNGGTQGYLRYRSTSDDSFRLNFDRIPNTVTLATNPVLHLFIYNSAVDVAGLNYAIQYEMSYKAEGDPGATGVFEETSVAIEASLTTTGYQEFTFTMNAALMSADDFISMDLTRLGSSNPSDTRGGEMRLADIFVRYTVA